MAITLPSSSFFTLAAATKAKYWMTFLVFSVLPAPDSPVINIDWFSRSKQDLHSLISSRTHGLQLLLNSPPVYSFRCKSFWTFRDFPSNKCRYVRRVVILDVRSLHERRWSDFLEMTPRAFFLSLVKFILQIDTVLDLVWWTAVIQHWLIGSSFLIISVGISVAQG